MVVFSQYSQNSRWELWGQVPLKGAFPRIVISEKHMLYITMMGTNQQGLVYKANSTADTAVFSKLSNIEFPPSHINNVQTLIPTIDGSIIAGIFRTNSTEPFLYKYDSVRSKWYPCKVDHMPSLGAFSSSISRNGTLWIGAKWSYIYKSTDNGENFIRIDESANIKSAYPCYYPSVTGNQTNGAIYSIAIDNNDRVYAGTEGAGVVFSDDGGSTWHPVDKKVCLEVDVEKRDTLSHLYPLVNTGNVGAIGITADNNLVINGTNLWSFGWKNSLCYANISEGVAEEVIGFPDYAITTGLQVTHIVTTKNGTLVLFTGKSSSQNIEPTIYVSHNGKQWKKLRDGLPDSIEPQSQGSLAVDGNMIFMATTDGKVWKCNFADEPSIVVSKPYENNHNVVVDYRERGVAVITHQTVSDLSVYSIDGRKLFVTVSDIDEGAFLDFSGFKTGVYYISIPSLHFYAPLFYMADR